MTLCRDSFRALTGTSPHQHAPPSSFAASSSSSSPKPWKVIVTVVASGIVEEIGPGAVAVAVDHSSGCLMGGGERERALKPTELGGKLQGVGCRPEGGAVRTTVPGRGVLREQKNRGGSLGGSSQPMISLDRNLYGHHNKTNRT